MYRNNTRIDKANLRNKVYPRNVSINGVENETFRIFEVVADGRCLFGTIWLLIQKPSEINRLLRDTDTYKEIEDFNDNGLNNFIETIFGTMTHCDKIKMMESFFITSEPENSQISTVIGPYQGVNPNIERYCNTDSPENTKMVEKWYQELSKSGVVGKFDEYLLSLHTNQKPFEDFEESYRYSDIELFANFLSDIFNVNINLIKTSGKTSYEGKYNIYMTYTGKPNPRKRNIYIYYKLAGHFQPMIPNSILQSDNRTPIAQNPAAVSASTSTYHHLAEMEEPQSNQYAPAKKSSDTGQSYGNRDASENYNKSVGSFDSEDYSTYFNLDENSGIQSNEETLRTEVANCLTEKKSLNEYFTFPKRLKIKYVSPGKKAPTDLPSTGTWESFRGKTSTTDRIQPWGEDKPDSVYSKMNEKFTNPDIQTVEIFNGDGNIQTPETYKNATENWYFLVTLGAEPVFKGGRTRKRHPKGGLMRSHKKRKMRTRGRRTKRRRFSQTKHQKR